MKILQLIDSLHIGGAERMAVNMANAFCNAGIANVLVCTRRKGPLFAFMPSETLYYELNKSTTFDLIALLRLFKLIYHERPTIVHAHSSSVYWAFLLKLFYPNLILIWHDHDGLSEHLKDTDRKSIQYISGYIDGIVAVNDSLKEWSVRNMKTKQVIFLRNFPYLKYSNCIVKNERNVILHLANLRPQKDHLTLIEAVRILKTQTPIPFQVWCAGNDVHDVYSKELKGKLKEYNLEADIILLGAVQDTSSLLEQASLGVLSSFSEGLPVSLLEYGLAALPVVVTNVGQCADVVGKGAYGLLVPPCNPLKLAGAIAWHLNNKQQSIQMGLALRKHVEQEYGATKFIEDYFENLKNFNFKKN
jgi:glycosyltransferase involved in cell wall biosynthesis